MSPPQPPQAPAPAPPHGERGSMRPSQRIAFGTLARVVGEFTAKLASLVFFIAVARELGEAQFGDFIFGLSLSTVMLGSLGLGMDELIARQVARQPRSADELVWNIVALKALVLVGVLAVIAAVVVAKGMGLESGVAVLVVSVGAGVEYEANTIFAALQGFERQQYIAGSLIVNRISTAALAIGALAAGGGLIEVAVLFTVGSALGLGTALGLMHRYVVRPRRDLEVGRWPALARASLPLGMVAALGVLVLWSSVALLGLLGGSSSELGEYGAAFRLIEATMFLSWSFSGAALPWFSRHPGSGPVTLARGFEMGLKAIISLTLPVAIALALFAEPIMEALYGEAYADAATPLRIIAPMAVLIGVNGVITAVLIGRDSPRVYALPAAVAITQTLVLSIVLIPPHEAVGAALTAVLSAATLVVLAVAATTRLVGSVSPLRVALPPLAAGAAMAGAALLLADAPWVLAALAAIALYGAALLTAERLLFPGDFAYYSGVLRIRRSGA